MLSESATPPRKPDERSDATERKWRSDFSEILRSLAPFPLADRQRYNNSWKYSPGSRNLHLTITDVAANEILFSATKSTGLDLLAARC
jgi:hypothetical protein